MARPALSAARGLRIVDLLAALPSRELTLTDIAKAVGVNPASCHAVLDQLERAGYLRRHAARKTYLLGPALLAAGAAAARANPVAEAATSAAARLRDEFSLPVLLTAAIGEEIVCIASMPDAAGRTAGLRAGERVPLMPPVGVSFVAWSSPETVAAWIARRTVGTPDDAASVLDDAIALTRRQGYHVTFRPTRGDDVTAMLARLALDDALSDPRGRMAAFVGSLDIRAAQHDALGAEGSHDVHLIAAPLFDREAQITYNLCLGGFAGRLTGAAVAGYGRRLVESCVRIMQGGL